MRVEEHDNNSVNVRNTAVDLAIQYFGTKGSNPHQNLIEVSESIYEFLTRDVFVPATRVKKEKAVEQSDTE